MGSISKDIFIVAAKRTAFGSFGGSIKKKSAVELGTIAAKAAIAQMGAEASIIDSVCVGNVSHSTTDCAYLARHVGLKAGVPEHVPALSVNRLCGSGFQSIVNGVQEISVGDASVVLAGGAESMSLAPYHVHGVRFGSPLGVNPPMVDSLWGEY
jgi:acetyl-CoA acyltransferase 2